MSVATSPALGRFRLDRRRVLAVVEDGLIVSKPDGGTRALPVIPRRATLIGIALRRSRGDDTPDHRWTEAGLVTVAGDMLTRIRLR